MPQSTVSVRIPQIVSIEDAIRIYYERIELTNNDIKAIFGTDHGSATFAKLKRKAREVMAQENTPVWNAAYVNTEAAYKAWGLDINDLERRWKKLQALNAMKDGA